MADMTSEEPDTSAGKDELDWGYEEGESRAAAGSFRSSADFTLIRSVIFKTFNSNTNSSECKAKCF